MFAEQTEGHALPIECVIPRVQERCYQSMRQPTPPRLHPLCSVRSPTFCASASLELHLRVRWMQDDGTVAQFRPKCREEAILSMYREGRTSHLFVLKGLVQLLPGGKARGSATLTRRQTRFWFRFRALLRLRVEREYERLLLRAIRDVID